MCLFVYPIGWIKYIKNDIFYPYIKDEYKRTGKPLYCETSRFLNIHHRGEILCQFSMLY